MYYNFSFLKFIRLNFCVSFHVKGFLTKKVKYFYLIVIIKININLIIFIERYKIVNYLNLMI